MKDRVEELASVLRHQTTAVLASYPTLKHTWLDQGAVVTLTFPPADDLGYEVAIQVGNGYVYVLVARSHFPFDLRSQAPEPEIAKALKLTLELLSPSMRVREFRSNDKPYRWFVERHVNGKWQLELVEEDVFFNYFGRRTERVCYNKQLSLP